jgi:hypothetical protein
MNPAKTYITLILLFILVLAPTANSQEAFGDAYMIGDYVNVAIDGDKGREGTDAIAFGFHQRAPEERCGFVSDPDGTGWADAPGGMVGDYFMNGTPENGFGLKIDGVEYSNNYDQDDIEVLVPIAYSAEGDCIIVDWTGEVEGVVIQVSYRLGMGQKFYTTEVTLLNTTDEPLTDLYYYRNVDPDNNQPLSGSYTTTNTIVDQPDEDCPRALVTATSDDPTFSYLGFAAIGDKFRVSHGGFSNRDAEAIWNGTGGLEGVEGTVETADKAISLAYKTDLAPGEAVHFSFVIILSEDALGAALESDYMLNYIAENGAIGSLAGSCAGLGLDTVEICAGEYVNLSVEGEMVDDFDWVWSPDIDLTLTEGTFTTATPTTTQTYTVTPTGGDCITFAPKQIVIAPISSLPETSISDDVTIEIGETTTLVASGGDSYEWFPTDGLSDPLEAITDASPTVTTEYFVAIASDTTFCKDTLSTIVTVIDPLKLNEENTAGISVFPNPFNEQFLVDLQESKKAFQTLVIYDMLGQEIYRQESLTEPIITINTSKFEVGTYLLVITDASENPLIFKIVKE